MDFHDNKCIIVDIDGTLSDVGHRLHHITGMNRDWTAFFDGVISDKPNKWCVNLCRIYDAAGIRVHLVTGRPDSHRKQTVQWLERYGVPYKSLFMRVAGDRRQDDVVKRQILRREFRKDDIIFVVDDRQCVVDMWRDEGLVCLQCNPHQYH